MKQSNVFSEIGVNSIRWIYRELTEWVRGGAQVERLAGVPRFRSSWAHARHDADGPRDRDPRHRFSRAESFDNDYHFIPLDTTATATGSLPTGGTEPTHDQATTCVDNEGYTATRVNLLPIGFNKARVSIQIDNSAKLDLIDLEVPAVVVIDPGHGGEVPANPAHTPGWYKNSKKEWVYGGSAPDHAVSYGTPIGSTNRTKTLEKNLPLAMGRLLKRQLQSSEIAGERSLRILMTRKGNNNVKIGDRARMAKESGADVFLSLHCNGDEDTSIYRPETWIEPSAHGNANFTSANNFALRIQGAIDRVFPTIYPSNASKPYRGIKHDSVPSDVYCDRSDRLNNVAGRPNSRACLAEMEWITNPGVETFFISGPESQANQERLASAYSGALIKNMLIQE